jgi:hypothetical protein
MPSDVESYSGNLTYAIETSRTENLLSEAWKDFNRHQYVGAFRKGIEGTARYLAWELPTGYDLTPPRALLVLAILIGGFGVPYFVALSSFAKPKIWRVFLADRLDGDGKQKAEAVRVRGLYQVRYALMFSLYSAFHLGWRDLNVGAWLSRLQGQEYTLRGSGWVRTMSGVQSLLSVYLLAMWALTQFGRLFEG